MSPDVKESSDLLTTKEAAERYRVSTGTIDRWIKTLGFPEPMKIGANRYWHIADLRAFEANRRPRG